MDGYDKTDGANSDNTIHEFIGTVVNKLLALPPEGVVLVNTPSSALDTLVRYQDVLFPINGQFYEEGHEVYAVYVYSKGDGDLYLEGTEPLVEMGNKHFITVIPEHMHIDGKSYASLGITPNRTNIVTMKKLMDGAHKEFVEVDDADFRRCGLNPSLNAHLTFLWWKKHYEMLSELFGLDATVPASSGNHLSAVEEAQDSSNGDSTSQVVNE
jgi:hypothetical protein